MKTDDYDENTGIGVNARRAGATQATHIRRQLRELRAEMRASGIRVTSCFNGGLTRQEQSYNEQLFRLKTELAKATDCAASPFAREG